MHYFCQMKITFPESFFFGTSTSAGQIETAIDHDWTNQRSRDGHQFHRTTDHEKRLQEDIGIIASLAPAYRMSLMWSKLQHEPFAKLDTQAVKEYTAFLQGLNDRGVRVMMVLHHFVNPSWFARSGGWSVKKNIDAWLDYGRQVVELFSPFVAIWNTFNEPNLYAGMAYITGEFPPFEKNIIKANRVIRNIATAHERMYDHIKITDANKNVGISHNCAIFQGENLLGRLPAKLIDWCYMCYAEDLFKKTDYFGMSYYARIGFDPFPVTHIMNPEKIKESGKAHDDVWEYYPQGLGECITRFWNKYRKPIIITENGICTRDDKKRASAIADYMKSMSAAMKQGADVRGYYHWTTWDNFEWSLGPTFQFGLYSCDPDTKERKKKPSADLYSRLAHTKEIEVGDSPD